MPTTMTEIDEHPDLGDPGDPDELVGKAQGGDRAAFDELTVSASRSLLARIQRRMGGELRQDLDPEDILQETFLRAFRSIHNFRWQGEGSFESWLHGIALKIIFHSARERGKWNLLRISEDPLAEGVSPSRGSEGTNASIVSNAR